MNKSKYSGIIPAFYACYDESGNINGEAIEVFAEHLINKGVKGVYVGGSSGECIYQSVAERKLVLERVMRVARGRITVIAHVAANNTKDSCELAAHAESLGVDAIAAIPPIYFHLPDYAIIDYWNSISEAAPNTDFIIYNIPQLAGVALSPAALKKMLENPRVIGVKNSSMPVIDIQTFKAIGGENFIVFNGPDEQLAGGLAMGAIGGIGGTYGVIPELYIKIKELVDAGDVKGACDLQQIANEIISMLVSCHGNLYAVIKEIIKIREGINLGSVRSPLPSLIDKDMPKVIATAKRIDEVINSL
jgi:N-acetylneuraminate lyase